MDVLISSFVVIYAVSKLREEDPVYVLPSTGDYMCVDPLGCSVCRLFLST